MSDGDSEADDAPDPARYARNRERVKAGFWPKFRRVAARLPFAEDLLAAYYAALDPATPLRVRAGLFAALTYFVMPADMIPDVIAGLGYTDDAAVLMAALRTLGNHIRPGHRAQAHAALEETVEPPPR
ncbi:MAG: YkvA family protein [Pseudomonadales bacterium]